MWLHEECLYLFYLFFFLFGTVLLSIQLCMVCRLILRWYVGSYAEFPLKCKEIFYYINSSSPKLLINHLKCFHFPVKQKLTIQWALWNWDYPCCGFFFWFMPVVILLSKLCPTLVTPWTVVSQAPLYGVSQTGILEWVAIYFSRGSFWPRDWTCVSCIGRWVLYH